jgi:hypothetical protein
MLEMMREDMAGLSRWGTWVAAASEERRQDDHMENWI